MISPFANKIIFQEVVLLTLRKLCGRQIKITVNNEHYQENFSDYMQRKYNTPKTTQIHRVSLLK